MAMEKCMSVSVEGSKRILAYAAAANRKVERSMLLRGSWMIETRWVIVVN